MRFDLTTLIAILTASALHMGLFARHPVAAFSCATFTMSLFLALRWVRNGTPRGAKLIAACTAAAFAWMMTFVVATMIAHAAYYTLVSGWPSSENTYIDMTTAIVLIVVMYGGGAAVGGFVIGSISAGLAHTGVMRSSSQTGG